MSNVFLSYSRRQVTLAIRGLSERWPRTPIVVASRPLGFRPLGGEWRELRLLPFDRPRRLDFLSVQSSACSVSPWWTGCGPIMRILPPD